MSDRLRPRESASRGLRSFVLAALTLPLLGLVPSAQEPTFVRDVRLDPEDDATRHSLVLEGGRVVGILEVDAPAPPGSRVIDGAGRLCLAGFVDAFATTGVEVPEPKVDQDRPVQTASDVRVEMREANRKGIQPTFRAATALDLGDASKAWRETGFTMGVVSPSGQLLAGDACLVVARDAAPRDVVVDAGVWGNASFRASGSGYPSTLMGYITQLRQLFLDAERHSLLVERERAGREGDRPRWDLELEAATRFLGGGERLVCEADTARDIERWIKIADEFGLSIAISGGREAWRLAGELARREIPVLLTLEWGEEVEDPDAKEEEEKDKEKAEPEGESAEAEEEPEAEEMPEQARRRGPRGRRGKKSGDKLGPEWVYVEPLEVRRERRRLWEEKRDCALRLQEAGVTYAFGTGGEKPKDLLANVRALVEAGLARDHALAALTTTPARLVGRPSQFGRVERGLGAHLVLWTDDPLTSKDAKAAWVFLEGHAVDLEVPVEDEEDDTEEDGDDRR